MCPPRGRAVIVLEHCLPDMLGHSVMSINHTVRVLRRWLGKGISYGRVAGYGPGGAVRVAAAVGN